MPAEPSLQRRQLPIPVLLRAVVSGLVIAFIGTGAWGWLITTNLAHGSRLPWAVPPMAAFLFLWWRYFARGWGAPSSTSRTRCLAARANRVAESLWGPALAS